MNVFLGAHARRMTLALVKQHGCDGAFMSLTRVCMRLADFLLGDVSLV